ncbi:hypothetical protein Rxyl_2228 [Rubrobacter xylanophilus DSM 9941]|uniref:Uncharacterized protein n=1 Tax=Rubrobacter xylanophilus (strain DSM 9941 / JCM 11954 / NBRC 16129 / PRD-1) TaxID=266117 RepID=Q1ATW1_RUBXD|nr:hypothetical protein Rxyl_2228 [Rubrobacter xylanophilus DSM 9941]
MLSYSAWQSFSSMGPVLWLLQQVPSHLPRRMLQCPADPRFARRFPGSTDPRTIRCPKRHGLALPRDLTSQPQLPKPFAGELRVVAAVEVDVRYLEQHPSASDAALRVETSSDES